MTEKKSNFIKGTVGVPGTELIFDGIIFTPLEESVDSNVFFSTVTTVEPIEVTVRLAKVFKGEKLYQIVIDGVACEPIGFDFVIEELKAFFGEK